MRRPQPFFRLGSPLAYLLDARDALRSRLKDRRNRARANQKSHITPPQCRLFLERLEAIEAAGSLMVLPSLLGGAAVSTMMAVMPPNSETKAPGVDINDPERNNWDAGDTKALDALFAELAAQDEAVQSGLDFSYTAKQDELDSSSSPLSDKQAQVAKTDSGQSPMPGDPLSDQLDGAKGEEKKKSPTPRIREQTATLRTWPGPAKDRAASPRPTRAAAVVEQVAGVPDPARRVSRRRNWRL